MHRFSFITVTSELLVTLYKPDTSLRRTIGGAPDGVRLRERVDSRSEDYNKTITYSIAHFNP